MPMPPQHRHPLLLHGEQLASGGQYDQAAAAFQELLRAEPENAEALNNLGVVALQRQDYRTGLHALLHGLRLDPGNPVLAGNLRLLLQEPSLRQAAVPLLEDALTHAEDSSSPRTRHFRLVLSDLLGPLAPAPGTPAQEKQRLLFLEQQGISTARFLDPICTHLGQRFDVRHVKTTHLAEAAAAIEATDVVWLEWAGPLTAAVTQHVPALAQKPVLCRLHGFEVFTDVPARINWQVVDRLIFVAAHKRDLFNQKVAAAGVAQCVIRNGVAVDRYTVAPGKKNTKKLVLLGHLNYRKGLPLLLQFYHELLQHDPAYHLYIRGTWQDERYQMAVLTMMDELQLHAHVTFVQGWIDDLDAWLADKSHILSFSLEESFHYALGEGMAAGLKPVIHAWKESRSIWPEAFIFRNREEFLHLMLEEAYSPQQYRGALIRQGLTVETQLRQIERLLGEVTTA